MELKGVEAPCLRLLLDAHLFRERRTDEPVGEEIKLRLDHGRLVDHGHAADRQESVGDGDRDPSAVAVGAVARSDL